MGRSPCCDKLGVKKGPWTPEEDISLVSYVQEHGPGNWKLIPASTGLRRCSKSCRLRWNNYLRPGIKRGNFNDLEEKMIIKLQALLGNKWAAIAAYLPERTDNDIKNYWNTHLKKKLKNLEFGSDSQYFSDGLSSSHSMSRGQWEKSLQTDIGMAKQAQQEVLSAEQPRFVPELKQLNEQCSNYYDSKPAGQKCVYASSTENIARLLLGWTTSSANVVETRSSSTLCSVDNFDTAAAAMADSTTTTSSDESQIAESKSKSAFGSVSFPSCNSIFFKSDESKPDCDGHARLSMLESWLLDCGSTQDRDDTDSFPFDDNNVELFY